MKRILCVLALSVAGTLLAGDQTRAQSRRTPPQNPQKAEMSIYPTADIQWKDGPASLPSGAKVAVLEGESQ